MKNVFTERLEPGCSKNSSGATTDSVNYSKSNAEWDKCCVKIKLRRDPESEKSVLYEFKMALFDNGDPDEFLLFVCNFQMTLKASGTLADSAKIQYIRTLLRG